MDASRSNLRADEAAPRCERGKGTGCAGWQDGRMAGEGFLLLSFQVPSDMISAQSSALLSSFGSPEAQFDRYVNLANHLSGRPFFAGEGELFVDDCFRHPAREVCDITSS